MSVVDSLKNQLEQKRVRLLQAITKLPEEAIALEGKIGRYSVADWLLVLAAWERDMAFGLREIQRQKKPTKLLKAVQSPVQYQTEQIEESNYLTWEERIEALEDARYQLLTWIEELSSADWNDSKRIGWLSKQSLWSFLAEHTYEHEEAFLPELEAYARQWEGSNGNSKL